MSSAPERAMPVARHGRLRAVTGWRALLRVVAAVLAVLAVSFASIAALGIWQFQSGIRTVDIGGQAPPPAIGAYPGGFNVLIVGADNSAGQGNRYGPRDSTLNDVNMLLHVSADHSRAVAVSIPRDLMVTIPECVGPDGARRPPIEMRPINQAYGRGGLPCVVNTVEALTRLEIQFAGLITFEGVIEMSNAVGGVPVCISAPIHDPYSHLHLDTAGVHVLSGDEALAFLRTRHGVGDESDLGRINSQQVFLASLVRTLKSDQTLSDLGKVFALAQAARANMLLSDNLGSLDTLVGLALALKDVPLENVVFTQYPSVYFPPGPYAAKVRPYEPLAEQLITALMLDEPFKLGSQDDRVGAIDKEDALGEPESPAPPDPTGSAPPTGTPGPTGTPTPGSNVQVIEGLQGQTADDETCAAANG